MTVPFPAGGGADILARFVSRKASDSFGTPFVVENRAGAAGSIGLEAVARSAPDGYTLLLSTSGSHTTNPAVVAKLPYDPIKDFAPVSMVAQAPFILLVHPSLPVRNVKELIALAKARPGELSYGSSGVGSTAHLGFELFNSMAGIKSLHVPYKGAGQATADTLAGNIMMAIGAVHPALPHLRQGRLRGLGVGSTQRSPLLPEVPTISESGLPGYELVSWYAVFAPGRTSPDIVRTLNRAIVKMISAPDVREQIASLGADPVASTPERLAEIVKQDLAKWTRVAREVKIRAD
jgi:tripartite-type tricarboxylate transporter receptor subunit TctC